MGRKQKYITDEEKIQANRDKFMRYYFKNKEKIKKKNLERYYAKKINN
jgi:Ca2+-binding EF-hand superfamily protein